MSRARDICIFHGSDTILAGAFSVAGSVAATGGKGRIVSLWDTDGGEKIMSMPPHLGDITALQFKADNTAIGSGDANGILKIWDLREGRLQRHFDGHRLKINAIDFHPNNETPICATGSAEGRTKLWDIRRKGFYTMFGIKGGAPVHTVHFSPDGRLVVIGDEDGLKVWDLMSTNEPLLALPLIKCKALQFHPREWLLVATSYATAQAKVHFIDLETMREESVVATSDAEIRQLSFHADKPVLLATANDRVDVVAWSPNGLFDHVPVSESGSIISAANNDTQLLMMRDSSRCSGVISAIDLTTLRLQRPLTAASRKQFEDSRPGTMEAFIGNDQQVRQIEEEVAEINISSPSKLALLFAKSERPPITERSASDLGNIKRANVQHSNFNKLQQPESLNRRQRSMDQQPSHFAAPYQKPRNDAPVSVSSVFPSQGPPLRQMAALPKTSGSDSLSEIVSDSIDFRLRNTADALQQVHPLVPDYEAVAESIFSLADESAIINVLRLYNENASIWTLKLCAILLNPTQMFSIMKMIQSSNCVSMNVALDAIIIIARQFHDVIRENLENVGSGINLQREERHERAVVCAESLSMLKQMLQTRQHRQPLTTHEQGKVRSALVELAVF